MAVAKSISVSSTGGELSCSVCLESFQEPKVLPCCHSFCLKCLEGTLERAKDKNKLTCPQCRTQHEVPPNGVHGFLDDYTVPAALDKTTSPPSCQQCSEGREAVTYCLTCSHLCEECHQAHKKFKIYRNHELMDQTDQKSLARQKKEHYCNTHPEELLKLYCKTCQILACVHCFVGAHNGHQIGSIDDKTRKEVEDNINSLVKEAHSKLTEFEANIEYIKLVERDKTEGSAPIKAEVNKKIDSLIAQLEARRTQLLEQTDNIFTNDLKELWAQKEYHEVSILSLNSALSFATRSLGCSQDIELLTLCAQITARLKQLTQLNWDRQSTEQVEITRVEFGSAQPLPLRSVQPLSVFRKKPKKACRVLGVNASVEAKQDDVGEIRQVVTLPKLTLISEDPPTIAKCGEEILIRVKAKITVNERDVLGKAYENMEIRAAISYGGYYGVDATVERETGGNTWTVRFTPTQYNALHITLHASGKYGQQLLRQQWSHTLQIE